MLMKEIFEEGTKLNYSGRNSIEIPKNQSAITEQKGLGRIVNFKIYERPRTNEGISLSVGNPYVMRALIPKNELKLRSDVKNLTEEERALGGETLKELYENHLGVAPRNPETERIAAAGKIPVDLVELVHAAEQKVPELKAAHHKPIDWVDEAEKTLTVEVCKLAGKPKEDSEPGIQIFFPLSRSCEFVDSVPVKKFLKQNKVQCSEKTKNNFKNIADAVAIIAKNYASQGFTNIKVTCDDTIKGASPEKLAETMGVKYCRVINGAHNPYEVIETTQKYSRVSEKLRKTVAIIGLGALLFTGAEYFSGKRKQEMANINSSAAISQKTTQGTIENKVAVHPQNKKDRNQKPNVIIVDNYTGKEVVYTVRASDKDGIKNLFLYRNFEEGEMGGERESLINQDYRGKKEVSESITITTKDLDEGKYLVGAIATDRKGKKGVASVWLEVNR